MVTCPITFRHTAQHNLMTPLKMDYSPHYHGKWFQIEAAINALGGRDEDVADARARGFRELSFFLMGGEI